MFTISKQKSKEESLVHSLLPLLAMLIKLMKRKNNGKKPFPNDFDFVMKISKLEQLEIKLLDTSILDSSTLSLCKEASKISTSCIDYIQTTSLKKDYEYLSAALLEIVKQTTNIKP